jgi:chromosome segregation protein
MQRIFVDFGTGTTADNVYFVTQIDHTLGSDGFKTEVKMGYGQGFATYTSLAQNLAAALAVIRGGTLETQSVEYTEPLEEIPASAARDNAATKAKRELQDAVRAAREALKGLKAVAARGQEAVAAAQARAQQKIDAATAAATRKIEAEAAALADPRLAAQAEEAAIAAQRASEEAAAAKKTADDSVAAAKNLTDAVTALKTQDPTLAALFVSQEVGTI